MFKAKEKKNLLAISTDFSSEDRSQNWEFLEFQGAWVPLEVKYPILVLTPHPIFLLLATSCPYRFSGTRIRPWLLSINDILFADRVFCVMTEVWELLLVGWDLSLVKVDLGTSVWWCNNRERNNTERKMETHLPSPSSLSPGAHSFNSIFLYP